MTSDPSWLPSAVMQTTAALLGIYAVVYVLAAQFLGEKLTFKYKNGPVVGSFRRSRGPPGLIILFDIAFILVVISGIITIYANYLSLASLAIGLHEPSPWYVTALVRNAGGWFKGTLFIIALYTLGMVLVCWLYRLSENKVETEYTTHS